MRERKVVGKPCEPGDQDDQQERRQHDDEQSSGESVSRPFFDKRDVVNHDEGTGRLAILSQQPLHTNPQRRALRASDGINLLIAGRHRSDDRGERRRMTANALSGGEWTAFGVVDDDSDEPTVPIDPFSQACGNLLRRSAKGVVHRVGEHVCERPGAAVDIIDVDRSLPLHLLPDVGRSEHANDRRDEQAGPHRASPIQRHVLHHDGPYRGGVTFAPDDDSKPAIPAGAWGGWAASAVEASAICSPAGG
jgi:hypothetical protein